MRISESNIEKIIAQKRKNESISIEAQSSRNRIVVKFLSKDYVREAYIDNNPLKGEWIYRNWDQNG